MNVQASVHDDTAGTVSALRPALLADAHAPATTIGARLAGFARSLAVLAVVLIPLLFGEVIVYKAGLVVIFFVGAIGLHVLVNWAGELSLAHATMLGIPAFSSLALSDTYDISPIYLLPVSIAVGAVVGTFVGLPAMRARGVAVALVTLVAGVGLGRFFFNQKWLVGGPEGQAAARPKLGPIEFTSSRSLYPLLLVIAFLAVVAAWMLMHSKIGRGWRWVQANPSAAAAFGVPVAFYRLSAYAIGGAFAGLGGGLSTMWIQRLGATAFPDALSFTYLLVVVIAGAGFVGGVAMATFFLYGGTQFATEWFGTNIGSTLDTVLAYGGPFGVIQVMQIHKTGLNGTGQLIMRRARGGRLSANRPNPPEKLASKLTEAPTEAPRERAGSNPGATDRPLLEVRDLSVSFGGLRALSDISMQVYEGQIVGLIGPNGAGKTTLFNVVSGLQRAGGGVIRYQDADITSVSTDDRAALGIGRSFQHLGLIGDETVEVNLRAAGHIAAGYRGSDLVLRPWRWWASERRLRSRARRAASEFGLADLCDERIDNLSFGKARFVELACVLVEHPKLMLLDEPTTGLDVGEVRVLLELLKRQQALGTTILLVAHDVRFIMDLCDHVYVLSEGRMLVDGPPGMVQHHPAVVEAYLGKPA